MQKLEPRRTDDPYLTLHGVQVMKMYFWRRAHRALKQGWAREIFLLVVSVLCDAENKLKKANLRRWFRVSLRRSLTVTRGQVHIKRPRLRGACRDVRSYRMGRSLVERSRKMGH